MSGLSIFILYIFDFSVNSNVFTCTADERTFNLTVHPQVATSDNHLRMRAGNVFGHVCLCVCFFVCSGYNFLTLDIETSFLVCRYILTISRSRLSIKVIG